MHQKNSCLRVLKEVKKVFVSINGLMPLRSLLFLL
jgi:hypothetical protein